jgi:HlyD family secretion protein
VALLVGAGCGRAPAAAQLATVEQTALVVAVEVTGELRAVDSTDVMPPPVSDVWNFKIAQLAEEGAEVGPGDPLVGFDTSELERELDTMRTEVEAAQKKLDKRRTDATLARRDEALQLAEAEAGLRRATLKVGAGAVEVGAIEQKTLELDRQAAETALTRVRNRAAQARRADAAELGSLSEHLAFTSTRATSIEANIARMQVSATRAGTVVLPTSWRGEKKKVGDGVWRMEAVVQVVSLDKMIGEGEIDEVDVARVADGQPVTLRLDALPDVVLRGHVERIARGVRAKSHNDPSKVVGVRLVLDASGDRRLRPGMRFRGEIETRRVDGALVVPAEAVFVTATGPVAYRLRGGGLEAVPLTLGARSSRGLQVLSGLAAGDRVSRVDPRVGRR